MNTVKKFIPDLPIYLHESNTNKKTEPEALLAVQQLRDLGFLCVYSENTKPIHLSFSDLSQFKLFQKACESIGLEVKQPIVTQESILDISAKEKLTGVESESELTDTEESKSGRIVINTENSEDKELKSKNKTKS